MVIKLVTINKKSLNHVWRHWNGSVKDSSRTQILNVNRPSNHPSTTKTLGQPRAPKKNGRCTRLSYYHNVHGQHLSSGTKLISKISNYYLDTFEVRH